MSHVCFLGHISVELAQEIPKALSEERESLEEAGIYTWVRSLAFELRAPCGPKSNPDHERPCSPFSPPHFGKVINSEKLHEKFP